MPTDSGSYNKFNTKIPTLSEDANIQDALKTFLYGSVANASAADDTLTAADGTDGLVGHLQKFEDDIASVFPVGMTTQYAGSSAPSGWLMCDGSAISRTTYSDLFAVVSTTYGSGDGSTTFNLPNLKGKVPVGYDSGQTEFDALGETGGAKTHTLTEAEMPSHTHTQTGVATIPLVHTPGSSQSMVPNTSLTGATGGGGAHNNMQPYLVVNYIVKT